MNILITDDNPDFCFLLTTFLNRKEERLIIDCAHSGEEALKKLKGKAYDLLLLDIRMPEMSGDEVVKQIKEEGYEIPIYMATADTESEKCTLALSYGATGVIPKPFELSEIERIVRLHIPEVL